MAIIHKGKNVARTSAIMYGIGLGLLLDEVGLLLSELTHYYSMETYSIVLIVILLLLTVVFFPWFWVAVKTWLRKRRDRVMELSEDIVDDLEDGGRWVKDNVRRPKQKEENPPE